MRGGNGPYQATRRDWLRREQPRDRHRLFVGPAWRRIPERPPIPQQFHRVAHLAGAHMGGSRRALDEFSVVLRERDTNRIGQRRDIV